MSESTEEKTKRRYVRPLLCYPWIYQTSVFYQTSEESLTLIEDMNLIKPKISAAYPTVAFMVRVQLKYQTRVRSRIALASILSTAEVPDLANEIMAWLAHRHIETSRKRVTVLKRKTMARSIKTQEPHDLTSFFRMAKVNRFTFLNKARLPQEDEAIYRDFLSELRQK